METDPPILYNTCAMWWYNGKPAQTLNRTVMLYQHVVCAASFNATYNIEQNSIDYTIAHCSNHTDYSDHDNGNTNGNK